MDKDVPKIALINLTIIIMLAIWSSIVSKYPFLTLGVSTFYLGGFNFVVGAILGLAFRHRWAQAMILTGVVLCTIGFGVCVGGTILENNR